MSEEFVTECKTTKSRGHRWKKTAMLFVMLLVAVGTLLFFWKSGDRKFYLCSVLLIFYAMVPFFMGFESRKPQARELVMLAVMCAIAVASRAAFAFLPHFKPMTAIIMIAGIAFGAEAGFLTGAMSGFVSNFLFGQGAWTPWQMFAYGIAGLLAGLFARIGLLHGKKPVEAAVFGGIVVLVVVGPLLDTCTVFTMSTTIDWSAAAAIYASGLPVNVVHCLATVLTMLLFCKPMLEKLERVQQKYGMLQ